MVERIRVGQLDTNCYLYSNGRKECIILDPGGDEGEIVSRISMLKMIPQAIILTHGHYDHTAAIGPLMEIYGQKGISLEIAIHQADRNFLGKKGARTNLDTLSSLGVVDESHLMEFFSDLPEPTILLKEGDTVFNTGLVVLETPGHTPGSICLYSEKDGLLFSGDTLFFQGVGRTDLPGGSDAMLLDSIRRKLLVLPPETRVFAGHGLPTTIEREVKGNPFLRA
jgi:glyoxylase-like metal-dependent hydrolase (beta-lactamase superfamily II)